jgi:hypothetical protein
VKGIWLTELVHSDIHEIFPDTWGAESWRWRDWLWREIEDGNVSTHEVILPTRHLPPIERFSGRTDEHRLLCARVAAWLTLNGRGFSACELGYQGGIADVRSEDFKIYVECGSTRSQKIIEGLDAGLDMVVAAYGFRPLLFRRVRELHFGPMMTEMLKATVERLPIALRYEDRHKPR